MISTRISPEDIGPSLAFSERISSRPPGISSISALNSTRVSRNQTPTSITRDSGTPTSIHWPKPMVTPWVSDMYPASRVFGGVPIRVPSEPTEAA